MTQLEIQFFWPLTEQIELDLDYTGCDTRLSTLHYEQKNSNFIIANNLASSVIVPSYIVLNTDDLRIRGSKKPKLITRILYKLLNIKWEVQ